MRPYHKIDSVFKRDMTNKAKTLIIGDYANDAFEYLAHNQWVFTEKVDGTNIRVMISAGGGGITFGGKTDDAQMPAALVTRLQAIFLPQEKALSEAFPAGGCLYGEGYGARIQKGGGNYRPDQDFVLFDVRVGDHWLQRSDIEDVSHKFGIDIVPIIGRGTIAEMVALARAGFNSRWGNFEAEGIVARPAVELNMRNGGRIITKIKHRDFVSG